MKALVTGGAGFIAKNLEKRLLKDGWNVISVDISNEDMSCFEDNDNFTFERLDATDTSELAEISKGCDTVFHLAANTDIRLTKDLPELEFKRTFLTTRSVLECMRTNNIEKLFFSSSSAVYGIKDGLLKEDMGYLRPVSYYGSYKLASESLIKTYSAINGIDALIFRLPNVVGPNMTHGVVFDFINKLKNDPEGLEILGNGEQEKQYSYVSDIINGIMNFLKRTSGIELYNISNDSSITVNEIANIVCEKMNLEPNYEYTGGDTGWEGDVPRYMFDISKARAKGWTFKYDSETAIRESVTEQLEQLR